MEATYHIQNFSNFREPLQLNLMSRIISIIPKKGFLDRILLNLENKIINSFTEKWANGNTVITAGMVIIEKMPIEEAIPFKKSVSKVISQIVRINESLLKDEYPITPEYTLAYNSILKTLAKADSILHRIITKGNPIQKTPIEIRKGITSVTMESFSKKVTA